MIQLFRPFYDEQEIRAVSKVLRSGWIGLGPKTKEFEQNFAKYVNSRHAIAVNSATSGLHLAIHILSQKTGKGEVLVPTMTFVSTAFAAEYEGMKVKFVDIDPETLNIDINDLKQKISRNTKIVVPVHYGGNACNIKEILKLSKKHGFKVVEDCAHASGSFLNKKHLGTFGDIGVFSFHAVKNIAVGDGGMLVTNNKKIAEKAIKLRWMGINKDTFSRSKQKGYDWKYEISDLGYKYHLNDVLSSIGIVQLKKLEKANKKRRRIAEYYRKHLAEIKWIKCLKQTPNCVSATHNFVIKIETKREQFRNYLKKHGIQTGVHYMPVHLFKYYKKQGHKCPNAEKTWKKILTLPMHPLLTRKKLKKIVETIKSYK